MKIILIGLAAAAISTTTYAAGYDEIESKLDDIEFEQWRDRMHERREVQEILDEIRRNREDY